MFYAEFRKSGSFISYTFLYYRHVKVFHAMKFGEINQIYFCSTISSASAGDWYKEDLTQVFVTATRDAL